MVHFLQIVVFVVHHLQLFAFGDQLVGDVLVFLSEVVQPLLLPRQRLPKSLHLFPRFQHLLFDLSPAANGQDALFPLQTVNDLILLL